VTHYHSSPFYRPAQQRDMNRTITAIAEQPRSVRALLVPPDGFSAETKVGGPEGLVLVGVPAGAAVGISVDVSEGGEVGV
jgi:hypothetical protein